MSTEWCFKSFFSLHIFETKIDSPDYLLEYCCLCFKWQITEFEHLLGSVVKALEKQYCCLTRELAIQLLSAIEPLRFENKKGLEEIALKYIP